MGKLQNNQHGFSAIEGLLILIAVAIIGGTGWYVYNANKKANTSYNSASQSSQSTVKFAKRKTAATTTVTPNQSSDPTAGWATYASASGGFSLKYPKTWVTSESATNCPSGLLMLGANSSSIGRCGTNNFGQMTMTWQPARAQCGLNSSDWTINSTQNVTVSGVGGLESNATSKTATTSGPAGTSTVQYCFITKGNMYVANYTELSSYPDVLADFNTMVTKTLNFN